MLIISNLTITEVIIKSRREGLKDCLMSWRASRGCRWASQGSQANRWMDAWRQLLSILLDFSLFRDRCLHRGSTYNWLDESTFAVVSSSNISVFSSTFKFVFLQIHDTSRFYICFYYQHIEAPQIQKIALMSPKAFTCRSCLPNFKSLSCLVWSVGGSKYEKVAVGLLNGGIL